MEKKDRPCYISHLPPEMLEKIFSFLDVRSKQNASRVCSTWKEVIYSPSLWRQAQVKALLQYSWPHPAVYPSLAERGINRIHANWLRFDDPGLEDLIDYLPNLEELKLWGCLNVTCHKIRSIFSKELPNLKELYIYADKLYSFNSLVSVIRHCPNLNALCFVQNRPVSNEDLKLICTGLRNLKTLILYNCEKVTNDGIGYLAGQINGEPNFEFGLQGMLTSLTLNNCALTGDTIVLLTKLTFLKKLTLHTCSSSPSVKLSSFVESDAKLRELHIESCTKLLNVDSMTDIGRLRHLTKLIFNRTNIGAAEMEQLANGCKELKMLHILCCYNIDNACINHLAQMPKLTHLHLKSCSISDAGLALLASGKAPIAYVNLNYLRHITDEGLKNLAGLKSLQIVHLSRLDGISFKGLLHLTDNNPALNIQSLEVYWCNQMPNLSWVFSYGNYPILKRLLKWELLDRINSKILSTEDVVIKQLIHLPRYWHPTLGPLQIHVIAQHDA